MVKAVKLDDGYHSADVVVTSNHVIKKYTWEYFVFSILAKPHAFDCEIQICAFEDLPEEKVPDFEYFDNCLHEGADFDEAYAHFVSLWEFAKEGK